MGKKEPHREMDNWVHRKHHIQPLPDRATNTKENSQSYYGKEHTSLVINKDLLEVIHILANDHLPYQSLILDCNSLMRR